ncbi:hypothetical protein C3L33_13337, partial [Rhododendron williamsianum]
MKMRKNKGKIHPSPSSSSSSLSTPPSNSLPNQNAPSVLALLPAAILALISVLSAEDKEVLAYMVTRSMNSVNPSPSSSAEERSKKSSNGKKLPGSSSSSSGSGGVVHKAPFFDCECFDCYTSYWFRWDSSPDKELIHKAIEEFEEFLFNQEQVKRSSSSGKGKRRERIGRRGREKAKEEETEEVLEESFDVGLVGNEAEREEEAAAVEEVAAAVVGREAEAAAAAVDNYNKGLVRKVLPDVVGLFNSRLWGLWSPNV